MSDDKDPFVDMTLQEIADQCIVDSGEWFPNHSQDMGYLTICLAGETGEFANLIKKGIRGDFEIDDPDYVKELAFELTDAFIYMMNIAGLMGIDMSKMYQIKREINRERFGPEGAPGEGESGVLRSV